MAVYNGQAYLAAAIHSILGQSLRDFEFIIIDDASTDNAPQILADFAAQDARINLLTNPINLGLTQSLNRGLNAAKGIYIARQDADDLSLPQRLALQVAYFENHPQTALLATNADIINAAGEKIGELRRNVPPVVAGWLLRFYNHVGAHSATMFRREMVLQMGGYDPTRRLSQDYELWLRLAMQGEVAILPEVLLHLRQHPNNLSHLHQQPQTDQSLQDSRDALATSSDVSVAEVGLLRQFWVKPFPAPQTAPQINQLIHRFYHAPTDETGAIRQYIAWRWEEWLRSVSLRRQPWDKLRLLLYWLRWK